jgi:branched-chain amino acid aminotransferase
VRPPRRAARGVRVDDVHPRPAGTRQPGLRTARPTFYCYAVPFVWITSPERQQAGARLHVSDLVRIPPASVDPRVKNYHWLDLDLALLEAYDHGADLAVLRDQSGAITEGPGCNIFAWADGRWLTPAGGTLAGITRRTVIELARQDAQPVEEGVLGPGDLRRATEGAHHLHGRRRHAGDRRGRPARR